MLLIALLIITRIMLFEAKGPIFLW